MTITIYELLGLVKDGKAPKKIKSEGHHYYYNELEKDYYEGVGYDYEYLFKNISADNLNDTVEILEEENKIEKLPYYDYSEIMSSEDKLKTMELMIEKHEKRINDNWKKINELIDEINKLKENK